MNEFVFFIQRAGQSATRDGWVLSDDGDFTSGRAWTGRRDVSCPCLTTALRRRLPVAGAVWAFRVAAAAFPGVSAAFWLNRVITPIEEGVAASKKGTAAGQKAVAAPRKAVAVPGKAVAVPQEAVAVPGKDAAGGRKGIAASPIAAAASRIAAAAGDAVATDGWGDAAREWGDAAGAWVSFSFCRPANFQPAEGVHAVG